MGLISQYNPLLAPSKKGLHLPISLAKKTVYLSTHLKEELIDLFWKLSGCSLFSQAAQKEYSEHFYNG